MDATTHEFRRRRAAQLAAPLHARLRTSTRCAIAFALFLGLSATPVADDPARLAQAYADAIETLNAKHSKAPGKQREDELEKLLPAPARKAFDALLRVKSHDELSSALERAALAAIELDLERDFAAARERLASVDAPAVARVGVLVSRERFSVRGVGGLDAKYCEHFADVFDAVLDVYDELWGFAEYSKTPGKKLRVYVHLEPKIERPPHFAPQFPYHSQIDFPVADAATFGSPTPDGKFLFYGLCHELGHVVAMWGERSDEADHHSWAHYTGVAAVEALSQDQRHAKLLSELRDVRWRSLAKEREAAAGRKPGWKDYESTLALWIALHDSVGARAIGAALNAVDAANQTLRIGRVRYYSRERFEKALLAAAGDERQRAALRELFAGD